MMDTQKNEYIDALDSNAEAEFDRLPRTTFPIFTHLRGHLGGNRYLRASLLVKIEHDTEEFIVTELTSSIHGEGPTLLEAIAALRRIFSGTLDLLLEEDALSPYLQQQCTYLCMMIEEA